MSSRVNHLNPNFIWFHPFELNSTDYIYAYVYIERVLCYPMEKVQQL